MELKFNKSTDSEHKIKLDSELVYAAWRCGSVPAGGTAQVEVETAFVGNGAKVKIKGKSEGGKNLGSVSGKIRSNKFVGKLDIPADAEIGDEAYFEVDISKNGLSGQSNRVPVVPGINVTNMRWSAEEARRGDMLTLSAKVSGVRDNTDAKITIYEHDQDAVHDRIVELPTMVIDNKIELDWEYEYHEDTDEIPTEEEMERYGGSYNPPEYFFIVEIDGQEFGEAQESGLLTFKDWLEIKLADREGNPIADAKYILLLPDGQERRGTLNGDGYTRVDGVPPGRYKVRFEDIKGVELRT